jgi:phosphoribosyl 1,2-cyclic phosphodiesterase
MKLKIIGSNSDGNGYLLQSATGDTLLIECGVHINAIKRALNFNLRGVVAIISHSHGDHAKSIKQVLDAGINVYASGATLEAKGVEKHHRAYEIFESSTNYINGFKVRAFSVNHDVPCFGFLIQHEEMGLCVFLTDTFYCDYHFPGVNNFILECNHDQEIMYERTPGFLRERVIQSHMNIETCKGLLNANDLTAVNNIVLIHLSNTNSNAAVFKKEIEQLTGKMVHIADAGMVIENFNKTAI